jgi:hypothetical protein
VYWHLNCTLTIAQICGSYPMTHPTFLPSLESNHLYDIVSGKQPVVSSEAKLKHPEFMKAYEYDIMTVAGKEYKVYAK